MKMAFELNDLKGLLFLVLFTIPSTSSTNYDCKGKSFYCLDSTHFLICVDFGGGVLSTIDDFVLPCPSLTECHESNTYECELPTIVPTTVEYATSVTEKSLNRVVPLISIATTVPPELTTALPSTEKSTVVSVTEGVTSESNKEILESLKDEFTGGNEHFFEPTKFIPTGSIDLSLSVNNVNKTSTTLNKNNNPTANVETSSEKKVNNILKIIDVTTSLEGLSFTDSNEAKIYTLKSHNNNTDKIGLNITANELIKSKNLTSDEGQTTKLPTLSTNLSTDGLNVNSISETSHITSLTNTVPPEVTTVLPSTEKNTVTTVPHEVTTVQPSTENNTAIPALDVVAFESNKEILEKLKDELTGGNEKFFEHTFFVPPRSVSLSPSVDKVNKMNATTDKHFNPKPGIETSTENNMNMTVTDNSKIIDGTTSVEGLLITDFMETNFRSKSLNITHNGTNTRELNTTANELTKLKDLTGDEALAETIPTSSSNLNNDGVYLITLSEMSDKSVKPPINTVTIESLKVTTVLPSTEKNTGTRTPEPVTSNKEILESLKDEFTGGNEKILEPAKFTISFNPSVDKVSDVSAIVNKKNDPKPDISTEDTMKIVVTDSPKNIDVTTSIDSLQGTDSKNAHFIPNIVLNSTNNKELYSTVSELTKSENVTSYEFPTSSSSNLNTDGVNVISSFETSDNNVAPTQVTTGLLLTDKKTFTPALEETTSKLNKEILESLKDEFTGSNEKIFKATTATVVLSTDKNTFTPDLQVTTSKFNKEIFDSLKNEFTKGNEKIFKPTTATVLPSTEKNTFKPVLEVTTSKLNKEIIENLKDEFNGGNEKLFKPTTSVLPHSNSLNPSEEMLNAINITTDKNINVKEGIETSTESAENIAVTDNPKIRDIGTATEGILITDFKNTTYTQKLQNISHTTIDTRQLNITDNLTRDKAPANKFLTLSSNLNSGQKYYLDNIVSYSNQTNYYYSLHNLTTPIIANETTRDLTAITEKVLNITEFKENLNTNNDTDNIERYVAPKKQEDFLSNLLVQLEKSTTITPFKTSSPTVTPSNQLQIKELKGSEPFVGTSDTLNNASASQNKYETINNIDVVYTTFSTTEPTTNITDNQTGQNLDVLYNNGANTFRTTVPNNEKTTEVTSSTHRDTTPTESQFFVSGDNTLTTPITTHESISTTVSLKTIENSITPLIDSLTTPTPDIYVIKNGPDEPTMGDTKEVPIHIQVKSTTFISMENSIGVTPSPQFVVTTSTSNNLFSGKESSLEKQMNITTSDTIYITTFTTTPQDKTYEIKSKHVNNLIATTKENVNTKSSKINGSEDWNNTDFIKAYNLSNISSLTTEKPYGAKEENNATLNYKIADPSALESTITVRSTTEPSQIIKDLPDLENVNKNNVIDSSSVTIISTLSSSHKINVATEAMYTTSFTINENIYNKPTDAPSQLETITKAKVVTTSQNINNIKTNVKNLTVIQIENATPTVIYTQNTAPNLKTSEYSKEHKVEQMDIFSTTVKPIIEETLTNKNILKVTKLTSFKSPGTENQLHSPIEATKSNSLISNYAQIEAKANITYPKDTILTGYSKPGYKTLTSSTNFATATSGAGLSSENLAKNKITSGVKDTAIVKDSTLKPVTMSVSHEMLHSETTIDLPMEVIKTQTTYHSNIFVSPEVTELTAEQKPNIVTNRIPLAIMTATGKPNVENSSGISTVQASNSIANSNTERIIPIMASVSMVETLNIQKPKSVLGSTIFTENIFNDTANNSTYNTNLKMRDENNTTIKALFQANTQNMTFTYKILSNNTNKEDLNLEVTTNALEKALLNVHIGGKSKNENDKEDNEYTPYGSASRIELTTSSTLEYNNNKPVINTSYVTPKSGKSQTNNINISDTQTNHKDNESKTIPTKTKVPRAAIHGNEGKANISIPIFDCQNKTRGKYGDSKDCQKFYTCIGTLQPIVGICPNHTVFSEINKQCTKNLSHCVRNNQFHCLYEGRFSDFFENNVYYICVKNNFHGFLRYKLQCQGGYYLNKAIVKCEKEVEIYEYKESVSSVSENSKMHNDQNKSTIKSDESEKSVSNDFECKKEGLFPYSNDCKKYYVCSKNSKDEYRRKIKKCSSDEVYDKEKKKCVYADSIEC